MRISLEIKLLFRYNIRYNAENGRNYRLYIERMFIYAKTISGMGGKAGFCCG